MSKQVILTTVFGSAAENIERTFASFLKVKDAELHVFVFNPELPKHRHPQLHYHVAEIDPKLTSVRRNALFRRWTLADRIEGAEYAMVVDGTDAICLQPLPAFKDLLRGASVAAAPEWGPAVPVMGQGYTGCYLNAGLTLWHLPSSRNIRAEIEQRGRTRYRGPYDDQTTMNEVIHTRYFDKLVILPSQYNWRAAFQKTYRTWYYMFSVWPRVDSLDGVFVYHNQICIDEVLEELARRQPAPKATLPELPPDTKPLTPFQMFCRRVHKRWKEHGFT